jgi:hypothetical protein
MMLVGCGDDGNGGGTPDARPSVDAAVSGADAGPDARPDAAPQGFAGTVQVFDMSIFGAPEVGHGGLIDVSFDKTGVPSEMSAGNFGIPPCNATLTDTDNPAQANPDVNEGTVKVEIKDSTGAIARPIPDCVFTGGTYRCVSGMGTAGATASAGQAGLYTFMGTGQTAATAGQYLVLTGGTGAGAAMPIVMVNGMTLIVAATTAPPTTTGSWITAAGLGPVPGAPPPEFIADSDTVKVTIDGDATTHFGDIATGDIPAGDAFELDAATTAMYAGGIDLASTTPLMFGCLKGGGGACPTAAGTIINIQTTDATSFASHTDMGTPDRYTGNLTCASFGTEPVSIPTNLLAVLRAGNPTKMRVAVLRAAFSPITGNGNSVNVVAGHAILHWQEID